MKVENFLKIETYIKNSMCESTGSTKFFFLINFAMRKHQKRHNKNFWVQLIARNKYISSIFPGLKKAFHKKSVNFFYSFRETKQTEIGEKTANQYFNLFCLSAKKNPFADLQKIKPGLEIKKNNLQWYESYYKSDTLFFFECINWHAYLKNELILNSKYYLPLIIPKNTKKNHLFLTHDK